MPSAQFYRRAARLRTICAVLLLLLATLVAALLLYGYPSRAVPLILALVAVPFALVVLWRYPVSGVFMLFGATMILETTIPARIFGDDILHNVYFFEDIQTWAGFRGAPFSLAEAFMLLVAFVWIARAVAERSFHLDLGTLFLPLGLYTAMVVAGELHGMFGGGNFTLSLWEVRPSAYLAVSYVLTCNLVRTRRHLETLIWILVLGTGLKGVQGVVRYFVTPGGRLANGDSMFPHEQAFFFNLFLILVPIVFLYGGSRRLRAVLLLFLPFVAVSDLAMQRRAAILAIAVALILLLLLTAVTHPGARRWAVAALVLVALIFPPYYYTYQDGYGIKSEPARALSSLNSPDARDASSNLYRQNEDKDIMANARTNPIIGVGYGKLMATPYPLADISAADPFWNLMTHDSVLYIWMRLGAIGFFLFWWLMAAAIAAACKALMTLEDPHLRGLALFVVLAVVQQVIFSYLDLQWVNYRNMITLGVFFALIGKLPSMSGPSRLRQRGRTQTAGARQAQVDEA